MSDEDKPFVCPQPGCGMQFTNEDHLSVHIRKHDLSLALNLTPGGLSPLGLFSDMTPTPTKFLKNCEEMGLFQELSKNPFDDSFKKAMDDPMEHGNGSTSLQLPVADCDNLDTPQPPIPKVVIGGEVIHEHSKLSKELSSIVPKKRKFLKKSFSTSEDEDDVVADSPSVPLTGSSIESTPDSVTNNVPVHVTDYMYIPAPSRSVGTKTPHTTTTSTNMTTTLTSATHTSQSVPSVPVATTSVTTTTTVAAATAGSNLVIPVIVQLPTGQLVTVQVPASSLTNNQNATLAQNGNVQLTNGVVTQTQPSVLNIARTSIPSGTLPVTNIPVTQARIVQNNLPLTIKSAPKPSDTVQTTMLVNQPILQNVLNQSGSQPVLNQSNPQTGLQTIFNQSGTQAALQAILSQSGTQTVIKPVINQTVSQPTLRVAVSQAGAQSNVVGMPSVLNISGLQGVLNQSSTQSALKPVILQNKQIGLIATSPAAKVSQSAPTTISDPGNQSYAKQRLKAALQQQMTPSSGQKTSHIYQMVDVKREPQSSPPDLTSPGAVSSPESAFSPRASQMFDSGNFDLDGSDPEGRRMKFLERNRAAAARCRQKRKRWVQELEQKSDDLSSVNNKLCGEVKKLRGEVAHLKTMLLAHKDCPVTMQQRSQGQINSVMFEEDDIMEISLGTSSNHTVITTDTPPKNNPLLSVTATGSSNGNQSNTSPFPVGLVPNLGTSDQLPVVMKPISVITGPNSLAMIPKILNIDHSSLHVSSSGS